MTEGDPSTEQHENPDVEVVDPARCATCGRIIDPSDWHPVAAQFDVEGDFHLFTFCSADCRNRWKERENG